MPVIKFQPTRPLRGATEAAQDLTDQIDISTHAPLAGRDQSAPADVRCRTPISTHAPLAGRDLYPLALYLCNIDFNPRAPCGARLATGWRAGSRHKISTHAPLAGRDPTRETGPSRTRDFNPRAPCGARLDTQTYSDTIVCISTHAPLAGRDLWSECNYGIWKNQVISMVLAQQARGFIQQSMKINRCCHLGGIFVFGEGKFYFFQRFLIGFFCADNFAFFCCYIVKLPLSCFRIIYQLDFDKT